jgi:FxsC-like protein
LYFFVSHATGDDDPYVEKFFDDLSREVRSRAPVPDDEEVSFLDSDSLDIGDPWFPRLDEALSTCACFVALCSPRYFVSEFCGKEWSVFAERQDQYERSHNSAPSALFPVIWLPVRDLNPAAASIQYRSRHLGRNYHEHGLRSLMRLRRFEDDYLSFAFGLAQRIVDTVRRHPLPPPTRRLASGAVRSAFRPGRPARITMSGRAVETGGAIGPLDEPESPPVGNLVVDSTSAAAPLVPQPTRRVHFVLAAGSRNEVSSIRSSLHYYGEDPAGWAPYRPAHDDPLAVLARRVAAGRLFDSEVARVEDLMERIEHANRQNHVVILLVDAWATHLPALREVLRRYDERNEPTTGVMIPMSTDDHETLQHSIELGMLLGAVFRRNVTRHDDFMFKQSVPTGEAFSVGLAEILEVAQNRIFVHGAVYPHFDDDDTAVYQRPILEGPSTDGGQ